MVSVEGDFSMKNLVLIAALVAFSCGTSGTPPVVTQVGGVIADCAKTSVQEVAKDRLTEVEALLLVDDWKDELLRLAGDIGSEALGCIIDHVVNESRADVRASKDKNAVLKSSRGEEWIREQQITFKKAS
jgi:hypothetical protein